MGFFDVFKSIWKDGWTWKGVEDGFNNAGRDLRGAGKSFILGGLWNGINATLDFDPDRRNQALQSYLDSGKQLMSALGNVAGGLTSIPAVSQTFQTVTQAQNEVVKRPIGTAALVFGDQGQAMFKGLRGEEVPSPFSRDTWRQAWNDTRTVSAGQALSYMSKAIPGMPGVSLTQNALADHMDPRTQQGQNYWRNDKVGKWQSGSLDLAIDVFADPTIGAAKLAKAGKLRYLSKEMNAAAISRGEDAKYMSSARADKVFDYLRNEPNPDASMQRLFNNVPGGGVANRILWESAKIEDPQVARQLFNDSYAHMLGDPDAKYRIAEVAPRLAGAINDMGSGSRFADVAKDYGMGNPAADAIVNARRETQSQAFLDDVANGQGLYGNAAGVLANRNQPRMAVTSQWRTGIHSFANGGSVTFMTPAIQKFARPILPSSKFTRIVNFEDPSATAVENIRSNWEGSRVLPPDVLAKHVQAYATATTSEARYAAFTEGENEIFKAIAGKYEFTALEAERVMADINSVRDTQRAAFSQSRRYMSNDARKLAQALWDSGRFDESARLRQLADDNAAAVARGEQPTSHLSQFDQDGNNVLIPENFDVSGTPISPTQHADVAAAMDWRLLHQALWWHSKGPIGEKAYTVIDTTKDVLNKVSSVWKVSQLLRPGFAPRMLSDDGSRAMAVIGAGHVFSAATQGIGNMVMNAWSRTGRPAYEDWVAKRAARGIDTHDVVEGSEVETSAIHTDLAEARPQLVERPRTHTELAQAVLKRHGRNPDLVPQDVRDTIAAHAAASTDPTMDLARWVETNGVPKGLKDTVRVTKRERKVLQNYTTLGKAVADGVITPDDYVQAARSAFDHRPRDVSHDMASIIRQHKDTGTDPSRDLLEHALSQHGRDMFSRPQWQRGFLDNLAQSRMAVVDPFSGMSPEKLPPVTGLRSVQRLNPEDEMQAIEDYVHENIDELLKPTSLLHAQVMKDGFIELGVAKTGGKNVIKPTGGRRIALKDGKGFDYKQSGAGGLKINVPGGVISIDHMFDGAEGARALQQVSSRGENNMSWADRITDKKYNELMQKTRDSWRDIAPNEPHYAASWERAVNVQLGNDPVARQILDGVSDDDIVSWMRKTPDGQAYLKKLGPWQSQYWNQVAALRGWVDMYVPGHQLGSGPADELRKAVLDRTATFDHLKAVVNDVYDMPTVHGTGLEAAVPGKLTQMVNKAVEKTFTYIGDIPADRMARFPLAWNRYTEHVNALKDVYLAQYHKAGYDSIPADVITRVQETARKRAAADVKKYMYDATVQHDMARMASLMVPFGSAIADSFTKWGVIVREKPWVAYDLWKVWNAPDRGGLTTDESGNHRRWINGVPRWVSLDPTTNKETVLPSDYQPKHEYVTLQLATGMLPGALSGEVGGVQLNPTVNKDAFNTFLGLPTAGPLVSVPVNVFAIDNPEFAENKFISRYILPLGPQGNSTTLFVPSQLRTLYDIFKGQDGDIQSSQARTIYQTEMVQYGKGERDKPPTFAEAREKAAQMSGVRWLYQMSGFTPQFKSPYQPYVDYYRQLVAADPRTADAKFYEQAGPEFFILTASVTRNNAGIPATIGGFKAYQKYKDLIQAHPEIANLIIGKEGAGAFSSAVYQNQLQQAMSPGSSKTMRERMNLDESIQDVAVREGWLKYNKLADLVDAELLNRGLVSVNQKGAEDLKEAKARFIDSQMYWNQSPTGGQQLNPWFVDFNTHDLSRTTARLNGMSQIISDPRLQKRDDIRGLADYLAARSQMVDMMAADGIKTLNSNKAASLRGMWDTYVMGLREQNLSFADLYHRYLTNDEFLDAPL